MHSTQKSQKIMLVTPTIPKGPPKLDQN